MTAMRRNDRPPVEEPDGCLKGPKTTRKRGTGQTWVPVSGVPAPSRRGRQSRRRRDPTGLCRRRPKPLKAVQPLRLFPTPAFAQGRPTLSSSAPGPAPPKDSGPGTTKRSGPPSSAAIRPDGAAPQAPPSRGFGASLRGTSCGAWWQIDTGAGFTGRDRLTLLRIDSDPMVTTTPGVAAPERQPRRADAKS